LLSPLSVGKRDSIQRHCEQLPRHLFQYVICAFRMVAIIIIIIIVVVVIIIRNSLVLNNYRGLNDVENANDVLLVKYFLLYLA
jgi:hypothetical protein